MQYLKHRFLELLWQKLTTMKLTRFTLIQQNLIRYCFSVLGCTYCEECYYPLCAKSLPGFCSRDQSHASSNLFDAKGCGGCYIQYESNAFCVVYNLVSVTTVLHTGFCFCCIFSHVLDWHSPKHYCGYVLY